MLRQTCVEHRPIGAEELAERQAVVEDLGEERRRSRGVDFQAGLAESVLRHGERMTVRVQIAGVLQQERDQSIGRA